MFQDDVFFTCFAGEPALEAAEWAGIKKSGTDGEYEVQPIDKDPKLLKFTRDSLVPVPDAEAKVVGTPSFLGNLKNSLIPSWFYLFHLLLQQIH